MSAPTTTMDGATGASSPPNPMRASDVDRERVCRILHQATGAGMLTLAEAEDRLAAAYAARFRHELTPLTADLPDGDTEQVAGRGVTARIRALLLAVFALSVAARTAVAPVLARHKALTALAAIVSLVVMVLLAYWGLAGGEDVEA